MPKHCAVENSRVHLSTYVYTTELILWIPSLPTLNMSVRVRCLYAFFYLIFRVADGVLKTNVAFPGLTVECSIDGGRNWFDPKMASVISGKLLLRIRWENLSRNLKQMTFNFTDALKNVPININLGDSKWRGFFPFSSFKFYCYFQVTVQNSPLLLTFCAKRQLMNWYYYRKKSASIRLGLQSCNFQILLNILLCLDHYCKPMRHFLFLILNEGKLNVLVVNT